jgi:hypothetical protein
MSTPFPAVGRLLLLGLLVYAAGCDCPQPEISAIDPSSGPAGTIVEVTFTGGGLGGVVIFDGTSVETRSASSIGIGKKLRFTVPYNAATGSKNVQVTSSSQTSPAVAFNVTGPGAVPTPAVEGFAVGGRDGKELTVFGTGFTTLSTVFVDGVEVGEYFGNSLPLRELPFAFVGRVIITTPATPLTLGSAHTLQVRNPGNLNSNVMNFDVPGASRVCQVEFDAVQGIALPDYYVLRGGTVNTMRRSYNACGWLLELSFDNIAVTDPQAGSPFSNADLYSFWQANANVPASGNYIHGAFVTTDNSGLLGIMFTNTGSVPSLPNVERRLGYAVFSDNFAGIADRPQKYFRTTLHEAGHAFNLLHSDGSGNTTLMNQTGSLANNWTCFFSTISCTHLSSHTLSAVRPGGEAFGSSRSCNSQH